MNRVPLRLNHEDYQALQSLSKAENRSMNGQIVHLIQAASKAKLNEEQNDKAKK